MMLQFFPGLVLSGLEKDYVNSEHLNMDLNRVSLWLEFCVLLSLFRFSFYSLVFIISYRLTLSTIVIIHLLFSKSGKYLS